MADVPPAQGQGTKQRWRYDEIVIIVGAGIIGLSCAWRLAQKSIPVTVLEAGRAAREASWAGAGMLAPGGEIESDNEAARLAVRSLAAFAAFVTELQAESGIAIDFQQDGAVELAFTEQEAAALEQKAKVQAGLGIPSVPIARDGALYARFYPEDALVNPRDVTAALRVACERRGVQFLEDTPVLGLLDDGTVQIAAGTLQADEVLVTTGAWTTALLPQAGVLPVRGHLISYGTIARQFAGILRHGHTYLLQRDTGEFLAGATREEVGFNRSLDPAAISDLQARAETLLPSLTGLDLKEYWNGFRPGIAGDIPWIGRIRGRISGAFGHYRNGILLAPETARIIAELLA